MLLKSYEIMLSRRFRHFFFFSNSRSKEFEFDSSWKIVIILVNFDNLTDKLLKNCNCNRSIKILELYLYINSLTLALGKCKKFNGVEEYAIPTWKSVKNLPYLDILACQSGPWTIVRYCVIYGHESGVVALATSSRIGTSSSYSQSKN